MTFCVPVIGKPPKTAVPPTPDVIVVGTFLPASANDPVPKIPAKNLRTRSKAMDGRYTIPRARPI